MFLPNYIPQKCWYYQKKLIFFGFWEERGVKAGQVLQPTASKHQEQERPPKKVSETFAKFKWHFARLKIGSHSWGALTPQLSKVSRGLVNFVADLISSPSLILWNCSVPVQEFCWSSAAPLNLKQLTPIMISFSWTLDQLPEDCPKVHSLNELWRWAGERGIIIMFWYANNFQGLWTLYYDCNRYVLHLLVVTVLLQF